METLLKIRWIMLIALIGAVAIPQTVDARKNKALYWDYTEQDITELDIEELLSVQLTIATGAMQIMSQTPGITSVLTASDIRALGLNDIDEVIQTLPGIHVSRNFFGYNPIYTIRGIYSSTNPQVLVLINGVRMKNVYVGSRSQVWGGIPINAIERVELMRGPNSALYGADAFAGVINIVTKEARDIRGTEVGAGFGSDNSQHAYLLRGFRTEGGTDIALTLEYGTTDGFDSIIEEDAQTQFDRLIGTDASLAPGPVSLSMERLDLRIDVEHDDVRFRVGYQGRRDFGVGANVTQALDPIGRYEDDRFNADITYTNTDPEDWDFTAQASVLDMTFSSEDSRLFPAGAIVGGVEYPDGYQGNPGVSERHMRVDLAADYIAIYNHKMRFGVGYAYSDLYESTDQRNFGLNPFTNEFIDPLQGLVDVSDTTEIFIGEQTRKNWYLYAQDSWAIRGSTWNLTYGLRYDHYSDFGSTLNPRLALVWEASEEVVLKWLLGTGFRAPSFIELYSINNPVNLGNPDLEPEKIVSGGFSVDYFPTKDLHFTTNVYGYRIRDGIEFVPEDDTNFRAQNTGEQEGKGIEFEAHWKATEGLILRGNYAFQDSEDGDGNQIANVPRHFAFFRADWQFMPGFFFGSQINWIGERDRAINDPREPLDGYTLVDLNLRYKMYQKEQDEEGNTIDRFEMVFSVRNLFDEDAREPTPGPNESGIINIPNDLPLWGRSFYLNLRYRF